MIHFERQFLKYLLSGFINTIVGYSITIFMLININNLALALALSTIFSVFFNFVMYSIVGFSVKLTFSKFFKFLIVYIILYLLSLIAMQVLIIWIPLKIIAYSVFYPISILLSFVMLRKFVFKN